MSTNNNDTVVKSIEKLVDGVENFRTVYDKRLGQLEATLNHVEVVLGRPGATAANDNHAPHEFQSGLAAFARSEDMSRFRGAMEISEDPSGGTLMVSVRSSTMTKHIQDKAVVRSIARVVPMSSGDAFEEPIDADESGAEFVGEHQARPATDTPTLAKLRVPLNEIYANQPITAALLDASNIDLGAWIEEKIGEKFGRTEGAAFVSGDGVEKPKGFLSYANDNNPDATRALNKLQYVNSGGATSISADGLRDIYWNLRAPYRVNGTWIMASATANAIDKLKTGDGSYVWRDGMASGAPPSLLGRPVVFDENMPSIASGNFPVAFGDFQKGYVVIERINMRVLRDPFSNKPNVNIYCYRRIGGQVANTQAIKLLKIAA